MISGRFYVAFRAPIRSRPATALVAAVLLSVGVADAKDAPPARTSLQRAVAALFQPTTAFEWSGVYAGVQAGYGVGRDLWEIGPISEPLTPRGALGGGHVGYNWRKASVLLGVEADAEASLGKGRLDAAATGFGGIADLTLRSEPGFRGSLRFRAGYVRGVALAFVTGGVAGVRVRRAGDLDIQLGSYTLGVEAEHTSLQFGWTLGAGLEYALAPNWSARAEYRYADYGSTPWREIDSSARHCLTEHSLRVGVAYHFRRGRQAY